MSIEVYIIKLKYFHTHSHTTNLIKRQPEVPYDLDDEIADSWRDPDVLRDDMIARVPVQDTVYSGSDTYRPATYNSYDDFTGNIDAPDHIPDDYWVVRSLFSFRHRQIDLHNTVASLSYLPIDH
jgi:hypothetical protein